MFAQVPKFVSRYDAEMMHKLLNLENFSVYWDVGIEMFGHLPQADLAVRDFKNFVLS